MNKRINILDLRYMGDLFVNIVIIHYLLNILINFKVVKLSFHLILCMHFPYICI